ncbi:MAG: response regulator [Verrucomicrobiales bacterium]|nr:response regulator [Verrucomicrobiales bacterium]
MAEIQKPPGVLVVEDEEVIRNMVVSLCERNGYRTFPAGDGIEALEIIAEHEKDILVAILDIAMPRMTGTELYREMILSNSKIPVIVASGFLVDKDEIIQQTGGTPYAIFSKPYALNDLLDKINEIRDREDS